MGNSGTVPLYDVTFMEIHTMHLETSTRRMAASTILLLVAMSCSSATDVVAPPAALPTAALDSMRVSSRSISADGAGQIIISAFVPSTMLEKVTTVYFTTTGGTLGSGTAVNAAVNDRGVARAVLTAPTAPTVIFVSASAYATVKTDSILATVALPDTMSVSAASALIRADTLTVVNEVAVTAQLTRKSGNVSSGLTVEWSATAPNGIAPVFSAVTLSNTTGVATAKYSPGLTSYRGPVTITVKTKGSTGATLSASTVVYLLPPEAAKSSNE